MVKRVEIEDGIKTSDTNKYFLVISTARNMFFVHCPLQVLYIHISNVRSVKVNTSTRHSFIIELVTQQKFGGYVKLCTYLHIFSTVCKNVWTTGFPAIYFVNKLTEKN